MNHSAISPAALLVLFAGSTSTALAQSTTPFPAEFELSSLRAASGSNGFVIYGDDSRGHSGNSVSSAGDVNGDGIDDIIIGAYRAGRTFGLLDSRGESYVVFGATDLGDGGVGTGGWFHLSSLNGANGFVLNGIDEYDHSGNSVSSAGDVNGDGFDDLIIGAGRADGNGKGDGESYVVFGAADLGVGGVGTGGSFNLSALNGSNGFVLNGVDDFDYSGVSVSSAGDINGDGIDDLIIGAKRYNFLSGNYHKGESAVVFGAADLGVGGVGTGGSFELSSLNGTNGFVLIGVDAGDRSGNSVSSAGDVNGDGIDDLIIGASDADPNGTSSGESYVVFGATDLGVGGVGTGGSFNLSALSGSNGFVLNGSHSNGKSGNSVSSAGDVNGDGIDDLIIGAPGYWDYYGDVTGKSYVVFGATDLGAGGVGTGGSFELFELNGSNGFRLEGIQDYDISGTSVSSAGDINGDGIDDLIIGAKLARPNNGNFHAGESYVVFGAADLGAGGVIQLSSLNGDNGFVLNGDSYGDYSGGSVSSAGDVNGDGIGDLIIGASIGNSQAGESYVVFGRDVQIPKPLPSDNFNDNTLDPALWSRTQKNSAVITISEQNARLEVASAGNNGSDTEAFVYNKGWAFDANSDFKWKVDFFANPAGLSVNGEVGLSVVCWFAGDPTVSITSGTTAVIGSIGVDSFDPFFGSKYLLNGQLIAESFETPTPVRAGTVYFSYHSSTDTLSISSDMYDGFFEEVYSGLRSGSGSSIANVAFSGYTQGVVSDFSGSGVWVDNFSVDLGVCVNPCPVDLNGDGIVDLGDIQAFVTLFLDQDLAADFNADGFLDLGDIGAFVTLFLAGC